MDCHTCTNVIKSVFSTDNTCIYQENYRVLIKINLTKRGQCWVVHNEIHEKKKQPINCYCSAQEFLRLTSKLPNWFDNNEPEALKKIITKMFIFNYVIFIGCSQNWLQAVQKLHPLASTFCASIFAVAIWVMQSSCAPSGAPGDNALFGFVAAVVPR